MAISTIAVALIKFKPSSGGTLRSPSGAYYTRHSLLKAIAQFHLTPEEDIEVTNEYLSESNLVPKLPAYLVVGKLQLEGDTLICNLLVAEEDKEAYMKCKWIVSLSARAEIIERPDRFESVNEITAIKRITAAF